MAVPARVSGPSGVVTGVIENLSESGALLTNMTGSVEVGECVRVRLIALHASLHTTSFDTLELEAIVVRKEMGGFALSFEGDTAELGGLLDRALGRGSVRARETRERRYAASVPAQFRTPLGEVIATGVIQNISASGALLSNCVEDLEVGTTGYLRLMNLSRGIQTPIPDSLELEAEVARNTMGGFALRFLGEPAAIAVLLEGLRASGSITAEAPSMAAQR